jgi:hypothetical protein
LESSVAEDTILRCEKEISRLFGPEQKYAFEDRNGKLIKQYSSGFARKYDDALDHMVKRRMRQSIDCLRILLVHSQVKCRATLTFRICQ